MKDTYWSSRGGWVSGSKTNVYVFSLIGLFILLIAGINFVNSDDGAVSRAGQRGGHP